MENELNELALEFVRLQKQMKASQAILEAIGQAYREALGKVNQMMLVLKNSWLLSKELLIVISEDRD